MKKMGRTMKMMQDDENDEDDGDDPDDGDEQNAGPEGEMREQEIGWGEVGFSREEPLLHTCLPPSRCLTPYFEFTFSCDEDDMATQGLPDSMQGRQQLQDAEDVLKHHHNKNRQPQLPDPDTLELLHQVTESNKPTQHSRIKRSKEPNDGPKPTQITWYGPRWKSFLEDAKGECHMEHALQNPFPTLVKDLPVSVTEVLVAVLVAWDQEGKQFEAGIWPQQKPNMAWLLYNDLATWRSDLKKSVMSIAPVQYSLIPPPSVPAQLCAEWIEKAAAALLANSLFLCHGVDNMGKTRNFAHPALREGVTAFSYTGLYRIAQRRTDIFRNQLPLSCLALVGAVFNCILDGLRKNSNGKYYPKFTTKEYDPIYRKILQSLKDILKDHYHGPILLAQLWEWAQVGWTESLKIED
ncbi:uncharacterized protein HD556DRAFT_1445129 [Suillus plorans]|uniref:DUF6532 domain-containing protein n=1 Tax=Suillus plorans TaxID=116603 RepID=A0A9P7AN93_9AGAM|nr:uncharacterized protein HD556DRAFT_1445129 [Suillus plorans]KAG1791772.1 hypothetical protein HD556DRAFT_1445129 [Suillus plorans]